MRLSIPDITVNSGSYAAGDVSFLLAPIDMPTTPLEERERLIALGKRHYSEMIGSEDRPTRIRLSLFRRSLKQNGDRLARDIRRLAQFLVESISGKELTIVSIARAGTPIGVLLRRTLQTIAADFSISHYSISVIRDRGIDYSALEWICQNHDAASVRFVDGWTGKGTIANEIRKSLLESDRYPATLDPGLWVPLDICGVARQAAATDDYLIPSAILGGTISGLISRSILPADDESHNRFHRCVTLEDLRRFDLSRWFVEKMMDRINGLTDESPSLVEASSKMVTPGMTEDFLQKMLQRHEMIDRNRVKIGIGETVRVLLRRMPEVIYLSDTISEVDSTLIRGLADSREAKVLKEKQLPFQAAAIIQEPKSKINRS